MNITNNGKTLYFSDDEIENNTNGEKKVFVTKRINGKETHTKIKKNKAKQDSFNFNNEIVLGVTPKKVDRQEKNKDTTLKKEKDKKDYNKKKNNRKKKKTNKKIVTFIGFILLIIAVVIFAFTTPIFNITDIQVDGNEKISKETIINLSELKVGENIFKFNNKIVSKIKENRYINNVKISRKLPGIVKIQIEERKVKYQISLINSYTYIDLNGYILENSTINSKAPIIVGLSITENEQINNKRLNIEDLKKLNDINKIMEALETINIENEITEFIIEEENYVLTMEKEKKKIYIGDSTNLANKVLYLKSILEKEKENSGIVFLNGDLNNGFKPYFREE